MDGVFEALGDPTRRQILQLLAAGESSAGALVAALQAGGPITQPAVSQHLKVLREARLVTMRAEGTRRLYALDEAGDRGVEDARPAGGRALLPSAQRSGRGGDHPYRVDRIPNEQSPLTASGRVPRLNA